MAKSTWADDLEEEEQLQNFAAWAEEEALREQGEDEKRESKSSTTEYERIIQDAYKQYELEKLKQTEMLKTTPPDLNTYYKNKVDRYFNLMLQ